MKLELEKGIIGGVILENKYGEVAHILSPKNFSVTKAINYSLVWQAIAEMYVSLIPCDILSLTTYLRTQHNVDYAYQISQCTNRVSSAANIRYYSFVLLELDIREKVETLLRKHIVDLQFNDEARASAKAVLEELKDDDVFKVLEDAMGFLKTLFYPEEYYNQLLNLHNEIPKKVKQLKRLMHIETLFKQIEKIPDLGLTKKTGIALHQVSNIVNKLAWSHPANIDKIIETLTEVEELLNG